MNPYESPKTPVDAPVPAFWLSFPWRQILAVLSGSLGVGALMTMPFLQFYFLMSQEAEQPRTYFATPADVQIILIVGRHLLFGVMQVLAAYCWLRAHWWLAVLFNLAGLALPLLWRELLAIMM
ncbi:hypothetical protein [Lignipirellula cremea]|uniref:Uncharacterized protein n=1 Tax=Lignipirellula cremea TaxID=2528010 RepID=A0A518DV67_9BACT|nr:hypothetical protein [Lignipirellula cremea]QDU95731.1 hypothetical protein Pla8534_35480 [Lignipirellula cremea]